MPLGKGQGSGGQGTAQGAGRGMGRRRAVGGRTSAGPGGHCVCPGCGEKVAHQAGVSCYSVQCPKCGANMVRE